MVFEGKIPCEPIVTNAIFDQFVLSTSSPWSFFHFLFFSEAFSYFGEICLLSCLLLCCLSSSIYVKVILILVTTLVLIVFRLAPGAYLTMWVTSVSMQFWFSFFGLFFKFWFIMVFLCHFESSCEISSSFINVCSHFEFQGLRSWNLIFVKVGYLIYHFEVSFGIHFSIYQFLVFHHCSCSRVIKFQVFSSLFVIFSKVILDATWNMTLLVLTEGGHTLISCLWFELRKLIKWTPFFEPFDPMVRLMNCLLYCSIIIPFRPSVCKLWAIKVHNFSLFQMCLFSQSLVLDHFNIVFLVLWYV